MQNKIKQLDMRRILTKLENQESLVADVMSTNIFKNKERQLFYCFCVMEMYETGGNKVKT